MDPLFLSFQEAIVGRYSLERELGRGGMGVVYLARDVRLDRLVAIKLLPPQFAAHAPLRSRFMREARTAARLSHPYIVPIHAVEEMGDFVFYVMAYVDGETLSQRVAARGAVPPRDVTRILREVAWALAYAHAQGVVHRDVKPANILLEHATGRAMVTDFGIARVVDAHGETAVGELLGTPEYMSPEQASGEAVDGRSDLYSLGVVGFFALTGRLPFTASNAHALLAQHVTKPPPTLASVARGVPPALSAVIDRCLRKEREARYERGELLAEALEPQLEKRPTVPVPIRVFLDRRRNGPLAVIPGMIVPLLIAAVESGAARAMGIGRDAVVVVLCTTMFALPIGIIVKRLRALFKQGYGVEDIVAGARVAFDREREEFLYVFGPRPTPRERFFHYAGLGALAISGISFASMVLGRIAAPFGIGAEVGVLSTYAGIVLTIFSNRWRRLRTGKGSFWESFWRGPVGHFLGRIAGTRIGERAIPADRPTELAIAMSAESLFEALPRHSRRELRDLPDVLRRLEGQARMARARIAELDRSMADAQGAPARPGSAAQQRSLLEDLRSAREAADARLTEVVTALDTMRLNLLRLRAGAGSLDSITSDLAAATALGEEVDRVLEARAETERAAQPITPTA